MATLDIGIDLGTCTMMVGTRKKGIVSCEPSVVAVNTKTNNVIGVGGKVYSMIGREHERIEVINPLENGVISNYHMTHVLAKHLFKKAGKSIIVKPRVIACVPCDITSIEAKSLIEAFTNVGARQVFLIKEPVAAALGIGLDIAAPIGNLIVDIGGGTTDVAVLSLSGIVTHSSCLFAGNAFDNAIRKYIKDNYKIIIGTQTSEKIKKELDHSNNPDRIIEIKGRSLTSELPRKIEIFPADLEPSIHGVAEEIIRCIKTALENTPPELSGDIKHTGLYLTGGGSLMNGLDEMISSQIGVPVIRPQKPVDCALNGVLKAFDYIGQGFYGFYDPYEPDLTAVSKYQQSRRSHY